jgi:hypothetical protein
VYRLAKGADLWKSRFMLVPEPALYTLMDTQWSTPKSCTCRVTVAEAGGAR